MSKLTINIETSVTGYRIVVPGLLIEQKCPLHASKEAKDKAIELLTEALKELKGFKIK